MGTFEYCLVLCLYVSRSLLGSSGINIPREPLKAKKISVDTSVSEYNVSRGFIGVGFPHYFYKWDRFDLSSPKAISLASALRDATLRLYGTPLLNEEDIAHYKDLRLCRGSDQGMAEDISHDPEKLILSLDNWKVAVAFLKKVGWKLMMDFTALIHDNGRWVSRYARTLLDWAEKHNMQIPEFQLGNEPNLYDACLNINASTVVRDFVAFRELLRTFPYFSASKIIGPDVTKFPLKSNKNKYFEQFLLAGGCQQVDEISFHHYYFKSDSDEEDFVDHKLLDKYKSHLLSGKDLMEKYHCQKPLRLTETASSVGGGTDGQSNTFIAGFSWMDKLGMSALRGITRVIRHTFFGSFYALVNNNMTPNPDYYLTLVFSRFVEGPVFRIKSELPKHIRAYANCAKEYTPGSLVIYLMNLKDKNVYLNFTKYSNDVLSVYLFTALKDNLQSKKTVLNNEQLEMRGNSLPILREARYAGDAINIPAFSYAFVVATRADVSACKNYFTEQRQRETTTKRTITRETTWSSTTFEEPPSPTVSTFTSNDYDADSSSSTITDFTTTATEITTSTTTAKASPASQTMTSTSKSIIKYNVSVATSTRKTTKVRKTTTRATIQSTSIESSTEGSISVTSKMAYAVNTTSPVIFPTILANVPDDKETVTPGNHSVLKTPCVECVVLCSAFLFLLCVLFFLTA